jgi:demethylmenaquinone methyltransferase/2-methoxy-6-polyprenyl-1,4-benzoquinol methylase
MANETADKNIRKWLILVVLLPILVAFALQTSLFKGVDAPPSNYGSGSMFDVIARRYDFINRVLAMGLDIGWRQHMVQVVKKSVSSVEKPKLLDMATGTADVALMLRKEIPSATVLGLDPSHNMLAVGREKVTKAGWDTSDVNLLWADAQDFSSKYPASSFDAATMAFGIRNVPDREKALCEIHQVLKDQARFCILEFSEPDESFGIMGRVTRLFIRYVVPFFGGVLSGAPREYWHLQKSINNFPVPQEFGRILESIECKSSQATPEGEVAPSGKFTLDEIIQLGFGSVQIYSMTVVKSSS